MPIDTQRTLLAAAQAALDEIQAQPAKSKKRHSFGAGKALLLGAGLYTAGRVVVKGRGSGMLDAIQQRLPHQDDGDDDFDEELDDDMPEGEADEDFEDEAPEGEADADEEPADDADEPTAEADEDAPDPDEEDDGNDGASASRSTRGRSKAQSRR